MLPVCVVQVAKSRPPGFYSNWQSKNSGCWLSFVYSLRPGLRGGCFWAKMIFQAEAAAACRATLALARFHHTAPRPPALEEGLFQRGAVKGGPPGHLYRRRLPKPAFGFHQGAKFFLAGFWQASGGWIRGPPPTTPPFCRCSFGLPVIGAPFQILEGANVASQRSRKRSEAQAEQAWPEQSFFAWAKSCARLQAARQQRLKLPLKRQKASF